MCGREVEKCLHAATPLIDAKTYLQVSLIWWTSILCKRRFLIGDVGVQILTLLLSCRMCRNNSRNIFLRLKIDFLSLEVLIINVLTF